MANVGYAASPRIAAGSRAFTALAMGGWGSLDVMLADRQPVEVLAQRFVQAAYQWLEPGTDPARLDLPRLGQGGQIGDESWMAGFRWAYQEYAQQEQAI